MTVQALIEKLEIYFSELLRKQQRRRYDRIVLAGLFIISRIFRRLVQLRIILYQQRIIRYHSLGCLVMSIGNLTVGGTGKTPIVEIFSRILSQNGRRVAILSRGYRSKGPSLQDRLRSLFSGFDKNEIPPRVVSDGKRLLLNAESAGDEAYMLASNLRNVVVLVNKDRVKSGRYAIKQFNSDTLILDDGFQFLSLKPRLNILLIDTGNPFDNHHLLPRGFLREPIENIRRADYIFLTKSDGNKRIRHLKRFISKHNRHAEIIECTHRARYLQAIYSKECLSLNIMKGKRLASLCGIAAPSSFEKFLRRFDARLVYSERYADHHRYLQQEIISCINASLEHEADMIITTEKDAVRFPMLGRCDLPIYFLRVEIDILSGTESFRQCISRICLSSSYDAALAI